MKFFNEFNLKSTVKYLANSLKLIVLSPINSIRYRINSTFNATGIASKISTDLKQELKNNSYIKPKSLKDYVSISNYYVAKILMIALFFIVILVGILFIKFLIPWICSAFFTVRSLSMASLMSM